MRILERCSRCVHRNSRRSSNFAARQPEARGTGANAAREPSSARRRLGERQHRHVRAGSGSRVACFRLARARATSRPRLTRHFDTLLRSRRRIAGGILTSRSYSHFPTRDGEVFGAPLNLSPRRSASSLFVALADPTAPVRVLNRGSSLPNRRKVVCLRGSGGERADGG